MLVFGTRALIEAVRSGKEIEKLFLQSNLNNDLSKELMTLLRERNIPFQFVPVEKLNRMTSKNHQGAVGYLSEVTYLKTEDVLPFVFEHGKVPFFLILDRITDIRNFGAISRSAECSGVNAIIIPSRGAAQVNPDAVKTSAGALLKIPLCREENLKNTIRYLKESGLRIVACTEKASTYFFDTDLTVPLAIIMGSEEDGISPEYLKLSDELVKIPINGEIESLNVSVAAGVIMYETVRQRMKNIN